MVSAWALKRQVLIIISLVILVGALGFATVYPYVNRMPTCTDGRQDGNETGIDCGGSCPQACLYQVDQVSILWARAFLVAPGRYNAVAYLENHNLSSAIEKIHYQFRFADKDNVYIGTREGDTLVPPSGKFAVFTPALDFGNSVPVYTTFKFTETPVWLQVPDNLLKNIQLNVSGQVLSGQDSAPRLSALVTNDSLYIVPKVSVVAILYDKDGNAVNASSTYIPELSAGESAPVYFTWPEPFSAPVVAEEIIPLYDILAARLK